MAEHDAEPTSLAGGQPEEVPAPDDAALINERERQTLREAIGFLHYLTTQSPLGIYRAERPGFKTTYITPNIAGILGYRPEEILGVPGWWVRIMHPDDRQYFVRLALDGSHSVGSQFWEYRLRYRDGSYRWIRSTAKPERDASGAEIGLIGFFLDITDQKEAEAARERGETVPPVPGEEAAAIAATNLTTRLQRLMALRGMQQRQLARRAGVSEASVSRLLTGRHSNPSTRLLQALAGALDVSVQDLLTGAPGQIAPSGGSSSEIEEEIVRIFRGLGAEERARILGYAEAIAALYGARREPEPPPIHPAQAGE